MWRGLDESTAGAGGRCDGVAGLRRGESPRVREPEHRGEGRSDKVYQTARSLQTWGRPDDKSEPEEEAEFGESGVCMVEYWW